MVSIPASEGSAGGGLVLFAFVSSITPGPNNLMLWSSGMNPGLRGTARHLSGVNLGVSSLLLVTSIGVGSLFERWSWMNGVLRVAGSLHLLWPAGRIYRSGRSERVQRSRPIGFVEAVAFQYLDPKAWVMAITAAGAFFRSVRASPAGG